jgi:inhibitor of cysteine peptidase
MYKGNSRPQPSQAASWRIFAPSVLVCLMLLMLGCVTPATPEQVMTLTADDNGASIMLPVGATVQVVLESNPTTGYNWRLAQSDPAVLKLEQQGYQPSAPVRAGSGGENHWSFSALAPGTTTLQLEYVRSWEKTAPTRTFSATITVPR